MLRNLGKLKARHIGHGKQGTVRNGKKQGAKLAY